MEMEVLGLLLMIVCVFLALVCCYYAWKVFDFLWLRPKRLEKVLRKLGLKGNPYRFLLGDLRDMARLSEEARSKPMASFGHDIVPRVTPSVPQILSKYGKDSFEWYGPIPSVIVWEPEHIREILSKNYIYQKPPANVAVQEIAKGVLWMEEEKWAKHRKLINPAFRVEKLKLMASSFYLSCYDMLSKWDEIIPNEGASELDVWPYLQTLTSDVISRTAFGSNYEEGRKIFELQREQAELVLKAILLVYIPGWRFLPTRNNRRMKEIVKIINSTLMSIIEKRMKLLEAGEGSSDDLLGLLLESNHKEIEVGGNKLGMSMEEVIEECKLFYFAGQETTSSLLVWTMILLAKYTDWQSRARDEVLQLFGKRKPEYQELNNLKIINMIFHETMRLYPPGIMIIRMTKEESKLGENLSLPAGVQLLLPIILLHHDKKIWGDDVKEFNPSRFSEGVSHATQGQMAYLPFGSGPRVCLGQNFAMTEAKMAMAIILQRYSFSLSPSYSHAPFTVFTLQPQHGAHLMLEKLKD
ncbi:cytochrome P450 CYP72A219-like [Andrographis paniculata]|uniref:cytochrome P450 CYP72A219-like n=1 Tax=Andrographis paniculata TaxID=175694 RepID=UPI0021E84DB2|nr:cytochrome P450 CYP72A219-like [Andrographis paniculata]